MTNRNYCQIFFEVIVTIQFDQYSKVIGFEVKSFYRKNSTQETSASGITVQN